MIFAHVLSSERLASLHPVSKNVLLRSHPFRAEKEQVVQARIFGLSVYMQWVSSQEENLSLVVELDLERLVFCTGVSVSETPCTEAIAYYCELHSLGNCVRID